MISWDMLPETIANFEQLSLTFPRSGKVLENIQFQIQKEEVLVILGPSGCGKSSLLRILAGLQSLSTGSVRLAPDFQNNIGFVFQEPTLLPWRNLAENIRLPLQIRGKELSPQALTAVLKSVRLENCESLYPRELSGGMKMRASLARALCTQPKILLLDEPFSALDESIRHQLAEELRNLCLDQGITTVFVTHSLSEALFVGDRILSLSPRPAKIESEFLVPLPRRRSSSLRESNEFIMAIQSFRSHRQQTASPPPL